jgi:hypothetical protein
MQANNLWNAFGGSELEIRPHQWHDLVEILCHLYLQAWIQNGLPK